MELRGKALPAVFKSILHTTRWEISPTTAQWPVVLSWINFGVKLFKKKKIKVAQRAVTPLWSVYVYFKSSNSHLQTIKLPASATKGSCYHCWIPLQQQEQNRTGLFCLIHLQMLNSFCPVWSQRFSGQRFCGVWPRAEGILSREVNWPPECGSDFQTNHWEQQISPFGESWTKPPTKSLIFRHPLQCFGCVLCMDANTNGELGRETKKTSQLFPRIPTQMSKGCCKEEARTCSHLKHDKKLWS